MEKWPKEFTQEEAEAYLASEPVQRVLREIEAKHYTHRSKAPQPARFPVGAPNDPVMVKVPRA